MAGQDRILFICTGNICRSPLAEGVFLHKAHRRGVAEHFQVDSAGTGAWHLGEQADPRARAVAARHDVILPSRARRIRPQDLSGFDHLICMDEDNREVLLEMGARDERVSLLLAFDHAAPIAEVPDPYYGGPDGFETVYRLIDRACDALLDHLLKTR